MRIILIILALSLLAGCANLKQSQNRLYKVDRDHPELLAAYCTKTFPIISDTFVSYKLIKGDTVRFTDTLTVDCDTIRAVIKVPYYRTVVNKDTLIQQILIIEKDSAEMKVLRSANSTLQSELTKAKTGRSIFMWLFIGLFLLDMAIAIIYSFFKSKF